MRYLLLSLSFFISLAAFAQKSARSVSGSVYESGNKESVAGASVRLLSPKDSTTVTGTFSDDNGYFNLASSLGKFILRVSFLGFKDFTKEIELTQQNPRIKLDSLFLVEDSKMLGDITVEAEMPNIVVKGDTVEYNANAYLTNENALLKDLIENIPGADIDEKGSIKINGKPVNKILVDGKEFFGSDIKKALENLPANMIKKLQLYNKNSETYKITGIKDKEENPVLDLIVKEEFKMTMYGNAGAGYGSDDRYSANAFVNNMGKSTNMTLITNLNNTNSPGGSFGGFSMGQGETEQKNVGLNLVHEPSSKFSIESNLNYDNRDNQTETRQETQTFLEQTGDRFGKSNSFADNKDQSVNADLTLKWNIDTLSVLYFSTSNSFTKSKINTRSDESSYVEADSVTAGLANGYDKNNGFTTYNRLAFARNLGKPGRSVDLGISFSFRNDDSKGTSNSTTTYPTGKTDIIDQRITTSNDNNAFSLSASYNEPLGKNKILSFSYNIQTNNSTRDNMTRKKDPLLTFSEEYNVIDSAYTRNTKSDYINQDIRLSLQTQDYDAPWYYTVSFGVNPAVSKNKVMLLDSLIDNIRESTLDYSPDLSIRRNFSKNSNLTFHYSGNTTQPGLSQLSADTVIYSALSKGVGNPDLKMTFRNDVNLHYNRSDFEAGRMLNIMGSFSYTFNDIVSNLSIDKEGNSLSTYRNVDGQISAYVYASYDQTLRNKKFSFSGSPNLRYNRSIGYNNNQKSITNSYSIGGHVQFRFNSKKFRNFLTTSVSYNTSDNNLTKQQNINNTILNITNRTTWNLPLDFELSNNINFICRWGFGPSYEKSEIIWNPSLSKKIMKGGNGQIKIDAFDILNERTNLSRYENSRGITETWTNSLSRYIMVSFTYRFQISNLGKSKKKGSSGQDEPLYFDAPEMIIRGD